MTIGPLPYINHSHKLCTNQDTLWSNVILYFRWKTDKKKEVKQCANECNCTLQTELHAQHCNISCWKCSLILCSVSSPIIRGLVTMLLVTTANQRLTKHMPRLRYTLFIILQSNRVVLKTQVNLLLHLRRTKCTPWPLGLY
jgi:hypothetical protein